MRKLFIITSVVGLTILMMGFATFVDAVADDITFDFYLAPDNNSSYRVGSISSATSYASATFTIYKYTSGYIDFYQEIFLDGQKGSSDRSAGWTFNMPGINEYGDGFSKTCTWDAPDWVSSPSLDLEVGWHTAVGIVYADYRSLSGGTSRIGASGDTHREVKSIGVEKGIEGGVSFHSC